MLRRLSLVMHKRHICSCLLAIVMDLARGRGEKGTAACCTALHFIKKVYLQKLWLSRYAGTTRPWKFAQKPRTFTHLFCMLFPVIFQTDWCLGAVLSETWCFDRFFPDGRMQNARCCWNGVQGRLMTKDVTSLQGPGEVEMSAECVALSSAYAATWHRHSEQSIERCMWLG